MHRETQPRARTCVAGQREGRPQLNYARLPIHLPCRPIAHTHGTNWWTRPVPFSSHNSSFSLPSSFLTGPTSNLIHRIAPPQGGDTWPPMKWELTKWGGCQTHKRERGNLLQTRAVESPPRRPCLVGWRPDYRFLQRRRGKQATIGKAGGRNSWSERRRGENRIVGSFVCSFSSSLRLRRSADRLGSVSYCYVCLWRRISSGPAGQRNAAKREGLFSQRMERRVKSVSCLLWLCSGRRQITELLKLEVKSDS